MEQFGPTSRPESRIDQSDSGSQMGKRKFIIISIVTMPLLPCMSTVWCIEKECVSSLGERILKTKKEKLDTHRGHLASPTNCCPPLPGHWPGCQINGPRTSRTYWNSDNKPWPGAAWESVVKKKWKNQTHRLIGWWRTPEETIILPETTGGTLVADLHLGSTKLRVAQTNTFYT